MLTTNEYFDGRVKSVAFDGQEGKTTIGVIAAGSYQFATNCYEYMTVVSGKLEVQFPGNEEWYLIEQNEMFEIGPNETFSVRAERDAAYLCLYSEAQLYTEATAEPDGKCCGGQCSCH